MGLILPDAVFWDWDGTLADSYGFLNDAHNHTLVTLGFEPFKDGEYHQYFGKPRDILYPMIYGDKAEEAKDIFGAYVISNAHQVKTVEGAINALEFFREKNIRMGIVSNKKADLIKEELKHLNWEHFFEIVIGAGDTPLGKPSPEPLKLALSECGIDASQQNVWYVGDTENDLLCARDAICPCLFLTGHADTQRLLSEYNPLISFDNYEQLLEILVAI